jgi:hypothetical protein
LVRPTVATIHHRSSPHGTTRRPIANLGRSPAQVVVRNIERRRMARGQPAQVAPATVTRWRPSVLSNPATGAGPAEATSTPTSLQTFLTNAEVAASIPSLADTPTRSVVLQAATSASSNRLLDFDLQAAHRSCGEQIVHSGPTMLDLRAEIGGRTQLTLQWILRVSTRRPDVSRARQR